MRRRTEYLSALTLTLGLTIAIQPLAAQVHESFQLTFPAYNTGTGLSGAWQLGGFNAFSAAYTAAERSLWFPRLQTSGGRISGGAFPSINGATRNLTQQLGTDNTTAYVSVLLRPQGTLNAGVFNGFFGITLAGSPANELFVGKPGGGAVEEWVIEHRGGFGQVASGVPTIVGQTALLVVRADFLPGNDLFTLYTDPVPGDPEPASGVVKADLNLGAVTRVGIYSTGAFSVDEIRVGATYADVTPRSPFSGSPGAANCHGQTASAMAKEHGGIAAAASALGYASVTDLQAAVRAFCAG